MSVSIDPVRQLTYALGTMCQPVRHVESMSKVRKEVVASETPNRPWQRVATDLFEFEEKILSSHYYSDIFELDHLKSPSSVCHQKVKDPLCAPRYSRVAGYR